jgi:hypothetical protein
VDLTGMFFGDPPDNYFQNLWSFWKEVGKSVNVKVSAGLQVGAEINVSNKKIGAHVNLVSGELEILNDGKLSVNNTSATQGAEVSIGLAGVGVENKIIDNGDGTATKTETLTVSVLRVVETGAQTTSEHKENANGTYTETSTNTKAFVEPTTTIISGKAQAIVGLEVKVDVGRAWQAFKDFVKNTFNPD